MNIQIKPWSFWNTLREEHLPFYPLFFLSLSYPKKVEKSKRRDLRCIEPWLSESQPLREVPPCPQLQVFPGRAHLAIHSALGLLEINENIKSLSKETEDTRKSQMEIFELKNIINEINWVDGLNWIIERTEERIGEMGDRTIKIICSEQESLRDLWDYKKKNKHLTESGKEGTGG